MFYLKKDPNDHNTVHLYMQLESNSIFLSSFLLGYLGEMMGDSIYDQLLLLSPKDRLIVDFHPRVESNGDEESINR